MDGGHEHGADHAVPVSADTFDVTNAIRSAGDVAPSLLNVVIVPYSLLETIDGQRAVLETATLAFDGIEFCEKDTQ